MQEYDMGWVRSRAAFYVIDRLMTPAAAVRVAIEDLQKIKTAESLIEQYMEAHDAR